MKTIAKRPPTAPQHLRTMSGLTDSARVDTDRNIIYGVAVMQLGDIADGDPRPWFVDEESLSQLISLGRAFPKGLKARWTHPNLSDDGLGKFLGRWRKFRLSDDGQTVLADLHLSRIAFKGGEDSKGQWVMDMAQENPDAFGVSIAPLMDEDAMESLERDDGRMPIRLQRLIAADVVDEPAATRGGLFGGELSIATAPAYATDFLNRLFGDAEPDVVRERVDGFVNQYLATRRGGRSTATSGESEMANDPKGLTADDLTAALSTFGEKLTGDILGKVDEKLATLKPGEKPADEPAALSATEIQAAERKRCNELSALAKNSGLEDWEQLSASWIEKGLSLVEAKAAIGEMAIAKNGLSKDSGQPSDDPDAKYKAEYQKNLAAFTHMGLSLQEYVTSRKIDDGSELLAPKSADAA